MIALPDLTEGHCFDVQEGCWLHWWDGDVLGEVRSHCISTLDYPDGEMLELLRDNAVVQFRKFERRGW